MGELDQENIEGSIYLSPEEVRDSKEMVGQFCDSLSTVHEFEPQVIHFPDVIAHAVERSHKTLTQACVEVIRDDIRNADHVYAYTPDHEKAEQIAARREVLVSRTSIGETSAHQVFFAALTDNEKKLRVAVKPFDKDPEKAIADWVNMHLARVSGLHTFRPIGLIIDGDTGYTITERQDDIEPMDNADWTAALISPETHNNMLKDLQRIGPCIARLHDMGCYHGDTQLKNIVITQRGSIHLIDWEAASFLPQPQWWNKNSSKADLIKQKTLRDLKVLFGSLARSVADKGVGLMVGMTYAAQCSYFQELVLDPYINERIELVSAETQTVEDLDAATIHLGEIEEEINSYIKDGELYKSLKRSRHAA